MIREHQAGYTCKCGVRVLVGPKPWKICAWPEFPQDLCSRCLDQWRLANLEYEIARIKDFGRYA